MWKNEVKFQEKIPADIEYENNKQKKRYHTNTRIGLDEKIQINNRKPPNTR